ncbi:RNA 2',3'-cyclic phosphodiesterase [Arachnia propionica]|uniref:RNA 2',3'-cyclic phosphodiesterase n=1 Tax=Arachnia propionica TaxID=1750 RepID=A0A3P1TB58_9ACTN|nr:RNA 2',3'-cyclic phosphodiesterase [Arachnia propionica]RRD06644.1 RNA 2',3'-cyclic phosphodiesterase [Arachnia propionica]
MRCFLAVIPPTDVSEEISRFLEPRRLASEPTSWRWTRSERYHLTLAFMAEYPQGRIEELIDALDLWAARRRPETMAIEGAGAFGTPERAKVLHLGVSSPGRAVLAEWSGQLRALASSHGGRPDGAGFTPHLTVARSRRGEPAGRLLQALDTYVGEPFDVTEVALVQSHLRDHRHEVLHRARLMG